MNGEKLWCAWELNCTLSVEWGNVPVPLFWNDRINIPVMLVKNSQTIAFRNNCQKESILVFFIIWGNNISPKVVWGKWYNINPFPPNNFGGNIISPKLLWRKYYFPQITLENFKVSEWLSVRKFYFLKVSENHWKFPSTGFHSKFSLTKQEWGSLKSFSSIIHNKPPW